MECKPTSDNLDKKVVSGLKHYGGLLKEGILVAGGTYLLMDYGPETIKLIGSSPSIIKFYGNCFTAEAGAAFAFASFYNIYVKEKTEVPNESDLITKFYLLSKSRLSMGLRMLQIESQIFINLIKSKQL